MSALIRKAQKKIIGGGGKDRYQSVYWLLVLPLLVVLTGFYVVPIMLVAWGSISESGLGFDNYVAVIESGPVHRATRTTLRLCFFTTLVSVLIAYYISYTLTHVGKLHRSLMMLCVLIPFWVSALLRGFAWLVILDDNGIINSLLRGLGVVEQPIHITGVEAGVLVGLVHFMVPFALFPIFANMRTIDQQLVRAACSLGATPTVAFLRIFVPLSVPGVVAASVLVFIFSLGFYITPAILGRGRAPMIAEFIETRVLQLGQWGTGAALGMLLLVCVLALLAMLGAKVDLQRMFGAK